MACQTKVRACHASETTGYCPSVTHGLPGCTTGRAILLWGQELCSFVTTEEFLRDLPSSAHGCFCHQGPVSPGGGDRKPLSCSCSWGPARQGILDHHF